MKRLGIVVALGLACLLGSSSAAYAEPIAPTPEGIPWGEAGSHSDGFFDDVALETAPEPRSAPLPDDTELVYMPDAKLREAVLDGTGLSEVTRGRMRQITSISRPNFGITDLTGMEYASALYLVDLSGNPITSIEPLRGLDKIRQLNINSTLVTDIGPVATMPQMDLLRMNWTGVSDLTPVRGLDKIWRIEAAGTRISDLSPLQNLTVLSQIYVQETAVSDVSPLAALEALSTLSAPNTDIVDLQPIANKDSIVIVNVNGARVADISMIYSWPNLRQVGLLNQRVDGYPVVASATETTYRTTQATTRPFVLPEGLVLSAKAGASTDANGVTTWSDIPPEATQLDATIAGLPFPPADVEYTAYVSYPLSRADFINGALPSSRAGQPYEFAFTVDPGFAPGSFSLSDGDVPGLTLSTSGLLSGTPERPGTYQLLVERTDEFGNVITGAYQLAVLTPALPSPDPGTGGTSGGGTSSTGTPPGTPTLVQTGMEDSLPAALFLGTIALGASLMGVSLLRSRRRESLAVSNSAHEQQISL